MTSKREGERESEVDWRDIAWARERQIKRINKMLVEKNNMLIAAYEDNLKLEQQIQSYLYLINWQVDRINTLARFYRK